MRICPGFVRELFSDSRLSSGVALELSRSCSVVIQELVDNSRNYPDFTWELSVDSWRIPIYSLQNLSTNPPIHRTCKPIHLSTRSPFLMINIHPIICPLKHPSIHSSNFECMLLIYTVMIRSVICIVRVLCPALSCDLLFLAEQATQSWRIGPVTTTILKQVG